MDSLTIIGAYTSLFGISRMIGDLEEHSKDHETSVLDWIILFYQFLALFSAVHVGLLTHRKSNQIKSHKLTKMNVSYRFLYIMIGTCEHFKYFFSVITVSCCFHSSLEFKALDVFYYKKKTHNRNPHYA